MSTMPGPICRKFVPVEQSEVTSISKPDGVCVCFVCSFATMFSNLYSLMSFLLSSIIVT